MNTGQLKQLLSDNVVKVIKVQFHPEDGNTVYTVIDAKFDTVSRCKMFLNITTTPPPRTNKTQLIRNYLSDFKDTHTVLVRDVQKGTNSLQLSNDVSIDKEGTLTIMVEKREKTNSTTLIRR